MALPVALQLYSVRWDMEKDFDGTLAKVKALGYDGVEFAGYGDVPADVMKGYLEKHGLEQTSCHV
ncbi:MAG: sugar phosphate isomerase/epimerase, partial [Clostridia bacterium]|nr:sugar phosphate isomerase/epimerase [Clostridia bacterium]